MKKISRVSFYAKQVMAALSSLAGEMWLDPSGLRKKVLTRWQEYFPKNPEQIGGKRAKKNKSLFRTPYHSGEIKQDYLKEVRELASLSEPIAKSKSDPVEGEPRPLLLVNNCLPFTQSGYTIRTQSLMKAVADEGVEVIVVPRNAYPLSVGKFAGSQSYQIDGVRYLLQIPWVNFRDYRRSLELKISKLREIAIQHRATVIHTTTGPLNAVVASRVAADLGIPWIYEVRGEPYNTWLSRQSEDTKHQAEKSVLYVAMREYEKRAVTSASQVIALSEISKKKLIEMGAKPNAVTVLPNSINKSILDSSVDPEGSRTSLGLVEGPIIACISSIVAYEGIDDLVRAATVLPSHIHIYIVGEGEERPYLMSLARELGVEDRLVFTGRVSFEQVRLWYQSIDVFILPRRDEEVCRGVTPLKPLEALAYRVPIVASDLPAIREVTGGCGVFYTPGDWRALAAAVLSVLEQGGPIAEDEWLEKRTWSSMAGELQRIYRGPID